ncbi:MAG: lipid-A-disaccharide synthase N-terminal domain-containing protein [Isosphaeraceae bacterium]|nr:lipid-A-disaccharide synthase N-terminal domain-containing protein [Isosphaeraceae bacterium]
MWSDPRFWLVVGFVGQALFMGRFIVQWLASERSRQSVVPVSFWWLSIAGSAVTFAYAVYRVDPVFMLGQSVGMFVYIRNLMLIGRKSHRTARRLDPAHSAVMPGSHPAANTGAIPRPHFSRIRRTASSGE